MPQQTLQPVAVQERIQTIDIIRGFALYGILIVNFTVDNRSVEPWDGWTGFGDQVSYWVISLFMNDKFQAIYCFLFGLGFSLQMQRAEARNSSFFIVYIRRLIVLYLIGVVHVILTHESILPVYALVGFLLLFVRKLPVKLIPILAVILFLGPWLRKTIIQLNNQKPSATATIVQDKNDSAILKKYEGVYEFSPGRRVIMTVDAKGLSSEGRGGKAGVMARKSETDFVGSDGVRFSFKDSAGLITGFILHTLNNQLLPGRKIEMNIEQGQKEMVQQRAVLQQQLAVNGRSKDSIYMQFIKFNATEYWNNLKNGSWWKTISWYQIRHVFVPFLLGLYAGRRKIFYNIQYNHRFLFNAMLWGLIAGFICIAIFTVRDAWDYIQFGKLGTYSIIEQSLFQLSWDLGVILMTIGYVAALTLLVQKEKWKKRLSFLAPVGRMGLSNYILHTIPYILLFRNFGFGLSGKIGCFYRLLLAIPVAVLIYFLSRLWFKRFRIGPVEWLWRSLTYLKFQPMKLKATNKKEEEEL